MLQGFFIIVFRQFNLFLMSYQTLGELVPKFYTNNFHTDIWFKYSDLIKKVSKVGNLCRW